MCLAVGKLYASRMARWLLCSTAHWQVLFGLFACAITSTCGQIRYSIPEEQSKGAFVGDIAQDLGLDVKRLRAGRARIITGDNNHYIELERDKGILVVSERIDREQICGEITPCSFTFEIILENPIELHRVTVEIIDVNDHAPSFNKNEMKFKISESAAPGARFVLASAEDPDVGVNALQNYHLSENNNFILKQHARPDGVKYAEMVLQKPLDREQNAQLSLTLTAVDGGNPGKSGTVQIEVIILDANDNAPVFNQSVYKAKMTENSPRGTYLTTVNATDADTGSNGQIRYTFSNLKGNMGDVFSLDENSGVLSVIVVIDFEKNKVFEIGIEAEDQGGLADSSKVVVEVLDINDNAPMINIMSLIGSISEDAPSGTTVAVLNVKDADSDLNGQVTCSIKEIFPFELKSSLTNYYTLVTNSELDRETVSEYNITVKATDSGNPALSTAKVLNIKVSDVNDNAPIFSQSSYYTYVMENNSPGVSICRLTAKDSDSNHNARVSFILEETEINGSPASHYISINSETGVLSALQSYDYEQLIKLVVHVRAQDGGSPPLSSNVTVTVSIQDQNDNAPQVLYPVQTGGSVVAEIVPRSADVGYLVTKVVAVDVDSGQNAWLSYKLQKATDRALFEVGAQNGEIRTVRQVTDKDAVKQKLTVVVEDNGQPSRSTVVNINVAVADTFPEMLSEFTDFTHAKQYNDDLTFYLVLALAAVSFLFITTVLAIISVKIYRWRQSRIFYQSNLPVIPYYPPGYADTGVTGTLPHMHNYDLYMTTDSRKSDCKYSTLSGQNVLVMDPSFSETIKHSVTDNNFINHQDSHELQKPPNNDWRLPPNQRPGPSGQHRFHTLQQRWTPYEKSRAGARPEEAGAGAVVGTGPWPNPPTEAEQLQALMAAANEVSEATATLGPRYNAQYVPDYRQNVYIPGSTATLTANPQQQMPQQALPPPQAPPQAAPTADVPKAAPTPASKKKVTKKDKK
ncbi:protocadherin gamma-A10-like isoform X6 [Ictalurus furcatus]|uniref:protocadherin gamma-A10-like isoform X6 n=1 Tax=Ictalurus furcatus TaxID=66913 RepID=UPI0023508711|nr:protocadherin gamma-A10-like isoform X6 [Ictalurus furcatus]